MLMIVVTHEMGFAREVADRVVYIHEGQIVEVGSPVEVNVIKNLKKRRNKRELTIENG